MKEVKKHKLTADQFSNHLLWDIDKAKFNPDKSKRWLFQRVLEYGLLKDWKLIANHYGIDEIASELKEARSLEPRSLSFIALLSKTPITEFKCYKERSLNQKHWFF